MARVVWIILKRDRWIILKRDATDGNNIPNYTKQVQPGSGPHLEYGLWRFSNWIKCNWIWIYQRPLLEYWIRNNQIDDLLLTDKWIQISTSSLLEYGLWRFDDDNGFKFEFRRALLLSMLESLTCSVAADANEFVGCGGTMIWITFCLWRETVHKCATAILHGKWTCVRCCITHKELHDAFVTRQTKPQI